MASRDPCSTKLRTRAAGAAECEAGGAAGGRHRGFDPRVPGSEGEGHRHGSDQFAPAAGFEACARSGRERGGGALQYPRNHRFRVEIPDFARRFSGSATRRLDGCAAGRKHRPQPCGGVWGKAPTASGCSAFPPEVRWRSSPRAITRTGSTRPRAPSIRLRAGPISLALVYPWKIQDAKDPAKLRDDIKVDATMPPTFIAHPWMIRRENRGEHHAAPATPRGEGAVEMHAYGKGGHGFGLRPAEVPCPTDWPRRFAEWLGWSDSRRSNSRALWRLPPHP